MTAIAARVAAIRERIEAAARRSGRDAGEVRLVAAAKTQSAALVGAAIAAGVTDIGENYVQEAYAKRERVNAAACWHLIGHLQRNKARRAVELFDLVETVDKVALGTLLGRLGAERGRSVHVLVEVNLAEESSKHGVAPDELPQLLDTLRETDGLCVDGLMAIPPAGAAEATRLFFRTLRQLRDTAGLRDLSMGMSDDFEVAIEEGATIVRVGRAIFGARD